MKNKRKTKNQTKGITLIALVVTIIVLLILAGVSINLVLGPNGLITKAQEAALQTDEAQEREGIEMAISSSKMEDVNTLEISKDSLENALREQFGNNKDFTLTDNGDGSFLINMNDTQRSYYVESTGDIIDESSMIEIGTAEELKAFRDDVNSGNTYEGKYIKLTNDITLDIDEEWEPIGYYSNENSSSNNINNKPFCGIFDADGNEINGIYINTTDKGQGLFGIIKNAKILNLIIGTQNNINGGSSTGGIVGTCSNSSIVNSCNKSNVYGNYEFNSQVGGIAGTANQDSVIINCNNLGDISANGNLAGGIIGYTSRTQIKSCYNEGKINGASFLGGITGATYSGDIIIEDCYNLGNITGTYKIAGIVGDIVEQTNLCIIRNCYNIGNIIGEDYLGGIFGHLSLSQNVLKLENNYYLENTVNGNNGTVYNGSSPKTSDELKNMVNVLGNAFKEDTNNINNGYPILNWQ